MPKTRRSFKRCSSVMYTDAILPSLPLFREFDKFIPAAVWIMRGSIRLAQQGFEQLCKQLSARLTGLGLTPATLSLRSLKLASRVRAALWKEAFIWKLSGEVTGQPKIRLFLDSNVLIGEIVSPWGLDKATLSLCAAGVCRLVWPRWSVMKSKRICSCTHSACLRWILTKVIED